MKKYNSIKGSTLGLALGVALASTILSQTANAQSGTYTGGTGNYSDQSNWTGGVVASGAGSTATIALTGTSTVTLDTSETLGTLLATRSGAGQIFNFTGTGTDTLTLATTTGVPTINVASYYGALAQFSNFNIAGTQGLNVVTQTNPLVLQTGITWTGFSGAVTVTPLNSDGGLIYAQGNNVLSGTDLILTPGTDSGTNDYGQSKLILNGGTTQTIGALSGGVAGTSAFNNAYVSTYSSTGDINNGTSSGTNVTGSTSAATLVVGHGGDSGTFAGRIGVGFTENSAAGVNTGATAVDNASLNIVKTGAGTQVFSGANAYSGTTSVTGGTLLVTGTHTGAGAYSVSGGGSLGGSGGSITTSNANVTIASGGKLNVSNQGGAAGFVLSAGTLALNLGTGSLDISGAAADHSGELSFSLGAVSDKVLVSAGNLSIGSGVLNLSDFNFTQGAGFGVGTYVLVDDSAGAVTGSLASLGLTSNTLFAGDTATLGLSNNDITLTIAAAAVPEPSTWAMLFMGLGSLMFVVRRQTRKA